MKKNKMIWIVLFACWYCLSYAQQEGTNPEEIKILMLVYPEQIIGFSDNYVLFCDSSQLLFKDGVQKTTEQLLNNPDIQDMFVYSYLKGKIDTLIKENNDPGRIRNEDFFKKMYGKTAKEVKKNLVEIVWCPKLARQKIRITSINGVDKRLAAVSTELDEHPEWKDFLKSSGTFYWRTVRGTNNRLSAHSFGIAIDLNSRYSNYWQWDCKCTFEDVELSYKNQFPQGIIDIFEKHGFIWGGKWYHYDTMHFEYRPELLQDIEVSQHELSPEKLAAYQNPKEIPKKEPPISVSKENNPYLLLLFIIIAFLVLIGGLQVLKKWDNIKSWLGIGIIKEQAVTFAFNPVTTNVGDDKQDKENKNTS